MCVCTVGFGCSDSLPFTLVRWLLVRSLPGSLVRSLLRAPPPPPARCWPFAARHSRRPANVRRRSSAALPPAQQPSPGQRRRALAGRPARAPLANLSAGPAPAGPALHQSGARARGSQFAANRIQMNRIEQNRIGANRNQLGPANESHRTLKFASSCGPADPCLAGVAEPPAPLALVAREKQTG